MVNKILTFTLISILVICLVGSSYALTANIGNARMILREKVGDTVDRSVYVKNINNVSVDISASASGDLENQTTILNPTFSLKPDEEGNINFTIKVTKAGTTDTKIDVKFSSDTQKNGVVLSSNIIIIANGTDSSGTTYNGDGSDNSNAPEISLMTIVVIITAIILVIFVVVIVMFLKKGSRKSEEKLNEKKKSNK